MMERRIKMYENEIADAKNVVKDFLEQADLQDGKLVVIGCSTSEIGAHKIGSFSSEELGEAVFLAMYEEFSKVGVNVATQCCEHLNRALILEREVAERLGYEQVNVVPFPKAGGSFSTAAYKHFKEPVAVEYIRADAGIDIGDTLIGMHLKAVAVPLRLEHSKIGAAHVVCARTRPKCIGGERAHYDVKKL